MTSLRNKITDTTIICLVAAVLMIVAIFLPYAAARAEFRALIRAEGNAVCFEGTNVKLEHISMVGFLKIYASRPEGAALKQFCSILVSLMGAAALLTGVFAVLKKPVVMLFCDVVAFAAFYLHNSHYTNRNVIPSWEYRFGIGYYLFATATIVALAGGIWMLREKKRNTEPQEKDPQAQE